MAIDFQTQFSRLERAESDGEINLALDRLLVAEVVGLRSSNLRDGGHACRRDRTVILRGYPTGSGFHAIECCDECRADFGGDDLSEVLK